MSAFVSFEHPGDEYGLCSVACLPAAWLAFLMSGLNPIKLMPLVYMAGMLSTGLVGWLMDRLKVHRLVWMVLWLAGIVALVVSAMWQYESYQRAIAKNGSVTAYVSAASSLSLVLTSLTCVAGVMAWRGLRFIRSR